jgi:hypothetical protein
VPGECYKLDVDPTDEESEEPDAKEEATKSGHEEQKHAVVDDGSLDRLPEEGLQYIRSFPGSPDWEKFRHLGKLFSLNFHQN